MSLVIFKIEACNFLFSNYKIYFMFLLPSNLNLRIIFCETYIGGKLLGIDVFVDDNLYCE